MVLKLYNTLSRKKEVFKPLKKEVGMYTCGPTVYNYIHIGNFRTYILSDILKRIFLYNGYKVKQVMNVTDVGHLTSDADTGEDKIEKEARKEKKNAWQIAEFYTKAFKEDASKLNILPADVYPKATEHIAEQIALVQKLEKKGYTYKISEGIYFNTKKFKNYGKLARLKIKKLKAGKRIALGGKKHKTDFALWKFSKKSGERQQEWSSPWGIGFPGWHIECSAMSMRYLGEHFDIHVGGEDLVPVHHINEIAQSEAATGKKFVNYWIHGAFLVMKQGKMARSKGNFITIKDIEKNKINPLAYRYMTFLTHYKKQLFFSWENLKNAQNAYKRLKNIIGELKDDKKINKQYLKQFEEAINNDLDMPSALGVLWNLLRDKKVKGKLQTVKKMDEVLGLKLLEKKKEKVPKEIQELAKKREKARKQTNFELADKIREEIRKKGWQVEDTKRVSKVRKI
jgi:cysteinyl-tRNA synthetase